MRKNAQRRMITAENKDQGYNVYIEKKIIARKPSRDD